MARSHDINQLSSHQSDCFKCLLATWSPTIHPRNYHWLHICPITRQAVLNISSSSCWKGLLQFWQTRSFWNSFHGLLLPGCRAQARTWFQPDYQKGVECTDRIRRSLRSGLIVSLVVFVFLLNTWLEKCEALIFDVAQWNSWWLICWGHNVFTCWNLSDKDIWWNPLRVLWMSFPRQCHHQNSIPDLLVPPPEELQATLLDSWLAQ